jgi:hypothetical protein
MATIAQNFLQNAFNEFTKTYTKSSDACYGLYENIHDIDIDLLSITIKCWNNEIICIP